MKKTNIKEDYYYFLYRDPSRLKYSESVERSQKPQYFVILEELLDTSMENIQCLTKEETDMLRKYMGVYGKYYTITELSKELNETCPYIYRTLANIADTLKDRILRGCAHLKESYEKQEISTYDVLNTRVLDIDHQFDKKMLYSIGGRKMMIKELIQKSIPELRSYRYVSEKNLKVLVDYIHSIGFSFKDENVIQEAYSYK